MSILDLFLKNKGVKDPNDLDDTPNPDGSPTEKQVYEKYKKILSKDAITLEDFKEFLQSQISVIEGKWTNLNLESSKKAELIPYHTVYKTMFKMINAPQQEREQLEAMLNQLT